jgi:hypothetical protein
MKALRQKRVLLLVFLLMVTSNSGFAKIFYSKNEAMELAFGKGTQVEMLSLFPNDTELAKIQQLAKVKLAPGMFSFYVGKNQGKMLGYAAIETETVRTKPETLLIVLSPEGEVSNIVTLAFHEPPEYQPPERWYNQLLHLPIVELDFNKGVQGIAGATLSTRSALNSVRKIQALHQVMIKDKANN